MWFAAAALLLLISLIIYHLNKDISFLALCRRIKTIDGSDLQDVAPVIPGKTIFGNNFDILSMKSEQMFKFLRNCLKLSGGKSYILLFLECAVYNIVTAEDAESVFQSQSLIRKGVIYDMLHSFLGTGLLTSTDKKWHSRRKLLTPAFHFNILQKFVEVFKEESQKFVTVLEEKIGHDIALHSIIPKFTLNNVCETALGVKLDDIESSEEYGRTIHKVEASFVRRSGNPLMYYELVYQMFGDYKENAKNLQIVHAFSSGIIQMKRAAFEKKRQEDVGEKDEKDEFGKKKRYAMLDTLLDAEAKGLIDHKGICEEVDTFIFEGYDTTSTCLMFALMNLALRPDIQDKCYSELDQFDDLQQLGLFELNQLEYLECVIKETLRLYPSVPFISRQCTDNTIINGLFLPKNTQVNIHTFDILRDPRHFENPNEFNPDRFLPENSINRHPFVFVPFSAGPRNCIGQKFAMLEIKVLLASVIKNFVILPVTRVEDLTFQNGLLLRVSGQIHIKIERRLLDK